MDDCNAAEDLVQEAFIRLARAAHRIQDQTRAAAYLRSIVLNLARDHNRRGLVSLRHRLPPRDWLTTPNAHLDGIRPVEWIRLHGTSEVVDALQAEAAGAYA